MMKTLRVLLALLLFAQPAYSQGVGQLGSGQLWGNSTASRAPAAPTTVTGIIDRAISSTQGAVLTRQGAAWVGLAPGTAGLPLVSAGAAANVAYAILGLSGGGTAANLTASNGGLVYSTASALAILTATATANQIPMSGSSAAPAWSTATYPATTTINQILYSSAANTIAGLATANGGILNTGATGVPSITATPTLGLAGGTGGQITLSGSTSGTAAIRVAAAAGTATIFQLPPNNGTNLFLLQTDGNGVTSWAAGGSGTVTSVICGTGLTGGTITTTGTCAVDEATAGQFQAGTADKVLTADVVYTAETTTTYGATTTFDASTFINTVVTLTGNITTVTINNLKAGQCGNIRFIQDGTGSRTLPATFNANFKFAGGVQPVLSTAASSVDVMPFCCSATNYCVGSLMKAVL